MSSNPKTRPNCCSLEEGSRNGRRDSERQYQRPKRGNGNGDGLERRQWLPNKGGGSGPIRVVVTAPIRAAKKRGERGYLQPLRAASRERSREVVVAALIEQ